MVADRDLGEQVWALHLALAEASLDDPSLYRATASDAENIESDARNHEELEALVWILAAASPRLPLGLVQQARTVARRIWDTYAFPGDSDAEVDAWLGWRPESGDQPPYGT